MRILDLGCGPGVDLSPWNVGSDESVLAVDINNAILIEGRRRFPQRTYLCAAGESLPFADACFDRVISSVALPYMNIPRTLGEIHRVLRANGRLSCSLHLPAFTLSELFQKALPHPKASLFRLYVLLNGVVFHVSGTTINLANKSESCQTERGMRLALKRAGFENVSFRRSQGAAGPVFMVEAIQCGA
jgi:ubiquinone/menaquinone biosynthesis C-methylase UbiE